MIKQIMDGDTLIAIVGSFDDTKWGNHFITDKELPIQIGALRTNKGDGGVEKHIHKIRNRQLKTISNEYFYMIRGKVNVFFYNYAKKLVGKVLLTPQMFCCLYNGGHSLEFIKDDSLMVEVKNGAFTDVSDDKEKF
jgi:hypothetical protein